MSDEATANTTFEVVRARAEGNEGASWPPCGGCGLRNPGLRRSCLACGAPLGPHDEVAGPLPIDPPLLERETETAALSEVVDKFINTRQGGFVAIAGGPGIGATRLLRHVAEQLIETNRVRILTTTVRDADGPYAPITRLLWERFGITPAKGPQTARNEIVSEVTRILEAKSSVSGEHARRVVIAAGLPADAAGRWESDASRALPRLADSVAKFLQSDAETLPIAILVDKLDAASDDGLAVFLNAVRILSRAPVLIVAAGLPAMFERIGGLAHIPIRPAPLSAAACQRLCQALLPEVTEIPQELIGAVVRRSEGAPGRVREILLALIESGAIVTDESPWQLNLDALGAEGPVSSSDIVAFRLARLDSEARLILSRAAVVGEVFWEGAISAMTRIEENSAQTGNEDAVSRRVNDALRRLHSAELIAPIEESELALERQFVFAHDGLRSSMLNDQDPAMRRARHDVCAGWLELAAGPRADDLARAIASHLERAGLSDAAGRAFLRAARAARASYRGPLAVQLFDRALALLPVGDAPARIDALHDRGVVLSLLGRLDDSIASFKSMLDLAQTYGTRNKMAAALGRLGRLARVRGELGRSRELLDRALNLFLQAEDERGVAAVEDDLGVLAFLSGDYDGALQHSSKALEIRRTLDDPLGEALSTHNLGLVHFARGQPRQARAQFERALTLRETYGDIEGTVTTRNVLAALTWERGDYEAAEKIWSEILELSETLGDKRMFLVATHNLGEAAVHRGNAPRAAQLLDSAEKLAEEIGDQRALAEVERTRGTLARTAGDTERANLHLEKSLRIARSTGMREAEAVALRGLAEVCAVTVFDQSGEMARQAERYFSESIEILDELGAIRELARTRASFGRYLLERGEVMNGRVVLSLAVPILERLELVEATQARAALANAGGEVALPQGSP